MILHFLFSLYSSGASSPQQQVLLLQHLHSPLGALVFVTVCRERHGGMCCGLVWSTAWGMGFAFQCELGLSDEVWQVVVPKWPAFGYNVQYLITLRRPSGKGGGRTGSGGTRTQGRSSPRPKLGCGIKTHFRIWVAFAVGEHLLECYSTHMPFLLQRWWFCLSTSVSLKECAWAESIGNL